MKLGLLRSLALGAMVLVLAIACGRGDQKPSPASRTAASPSTAAKAPASTPELPAPIAQAPTIQGIVDPSNRGWPRQVEVLNGRVTILKQPQRIVTVSLGHDEITLAVVPRERVVAVGKATKDPTYSNIADLVQEKPVVSREPESIISYKPDIVVVDAFRDADFVRALTRVGLTVVQTGLQNDPQGRVNDIRLLGYLYGEEERAERMAVAAQERLDRVTAFAQRVPPEKRPRVLSIASFTDKIYAAGAGSTEGGIILSAGGRNAAAEAGLERHPTISLESIIAMRPEVIIVTQPRASAEAFIGKLIAEPALAEVPAIKARRVYFAESRYFTTLSFWNIRGVEELAKLLWPAEFGHVDFPPFAYPR